jgi:putative membrane protein
MDPTHMHAPHTGASFWVGMALMVFSSVLACLSTLSFRTVVRRLSPHQIPAGRFPRLALIANLGVAAAGLALTAYLALAAQ